MVDKIKIQHYVPQFYLRNFSVKNKKYLCCFDKHDFKKIDVRITNIGCEKYFYDLSGDVIQSTEKKLSKLESAFNAAYSKLLNKGHLWTLNEEEKKSISTFVVIQELRTKEFREQIRDGIKQLRGRLSRENISEELEKRLKETNTEESIRKIQTRMMNDKYLVKIVSGMKWILYINNTTMPYWTSDHPVTRHNVLDLKPYGNLGLFCLGVELHFPLSPKYTLCLCDPTMYGGLPDEYEIKDIQNIIFQNSLQVISSTRHVFSNNDDFALAERIVRENPSIGDINRKRVSLD